MIGLLRDELDNRNLTSTIVSASDESEYDTARATWNSFSSKGPWTYVFNNEVLLDLFDTHDDNRNVSVWLNILCNGTTYHMACHVREGNGMPKSKKY